MQVAVRVVRRATERAIQVVPRDSLPFAWLPRSRLPAGDEIAAGDRDLIIEVPDWLGKRAGMRACKENDMSFKAAARLQARDHRVKLECPPPKKPPNKTPRFQIPSGA